MGPLITQLGIGLSFLSQHLRAQEHGQTNLHKIPTPDQETKKNCLFSHCRPCVQRRFLQTHYQQFPHAVFSPETPAVGSFLEYTHLQ